MNKAFNNFTWENEPSVNTPINAENLNKQNNAIDIIDNRVVNFSTTKLDVTTANTMVKDVTFDSASGIFTITKLNGSTVKIDTKLEKLILNWRFDSETQTLYLILDDGTEMPIDLSSLIATNEFTNSDRITLTVSADGKVTADIVKGSITGEYLEPNYLANVTTQADNARISAETATAQADRATTEADRAEDAADRAEAIAGGDFASNAKVDAIINGTTTVGNADKLDGHEAEYFAQATQLDNYVYKGETLSTSILEKATTLKAGVYFYHLNGSYYSGNDLPTSIFPWKYSNAMILKRNLSSIEVILFSEQISRIAGNSFTPSGWHGWQECATIADLANYLPLSDGMASEVKINSSVTLKTRSTTGNVNYIHLYGKETDLGYIGFSEVNKPTFTTIGGVTREILHTGNKPSGTYTGNGDATARTISTGGIGNICLIYASTGVVYATPVISFMVLGNRIEPLEGVTFRNGDLNISSNSNVINGSGLSYNYEVH